MPPVQQQPPPQAPPDFRLTASPDNLVVHRGQSGKITVKVEPLRGFNGRVDLLSSLLYATTTQIVPAAIENGSGTAVLTVAPSETAIKGSYMLSITGTNVATARSVTVTVVVK